MNLYLELLSPILLTMLFVFNAASIAWMHKDDRRWYDWIICVGFIREIINGIELTNMIKQIKHEDRQK